MALEKKEQSALKRKLVKFVTPLFEEVEIPEPVEENKPTSKKKRESKPKTIEDVRKEFDSHGVPQSVIDEWKLEHLEELYAEILEYLNKTTIQG